MLTENQSEDCTRYQERIAECLGRETRLRAADRSLVHLRLILFLSAVACTTYGAVAGVGRPAYVLGGLVFLAFIAVVSGHDYLIRILAEVVQSRRLYEQGVARRERRWSELPLWQTAIPPDREPVSVDLDLFGRASLFQLVCAAGTDIGQRTLRDWMLYPADVAEVSQRQEAVAELAVQQHTREQLTLLGHLLRSSQTGAERFMDWAESGPWLGRRRWLLGAIWLSLAAVVVTPVLMATRVLPVTIGGLAIVGLVGFNCLLSVLLTGHVHDLFRAVSTRNGEAAKYLDMFRLLCDASFESSKLQMLKAELAQQHCSVILRLAQLQRLMRLANLYSSPLMLPVYMFLQWFFLWDFHLLRRLEVWQGQNAAFVRGWFTALGEFEALASLATLRFEHPQWEFPQVNVSASKFQATELGHPLLRDGERVGNDVELGPAGTFLLVTGSNMSGKSTLLRAIGTNAILALMGGPVCAKSLILPPVEVATSMRIQDSIAEGVSFFLAELTRLKEIVDLARSFHQRRDFQLLFLLDEVLQGTNSRERQIAVQRVVRHLLDCRAMGAISTHDVELAGAEGLVGLCQPVHFRESLHVKGRQKMSFDYVMRDGVATTTNALKLLALVGLDDTNDGTPLVDKE